MDLDSESRDQTALEEELDSFDLFLDVDMTDFSTDSPECEDENTSSGYSGSTEENDNNEKEIADNDIEITSTESIIIQKTDKMIIREEKYKLKMQRKRELLLKALKVSKKDVRRKYVSRYYQYLNGLKYTLLREFLNDCAVNDFVFSIDLVTPDGISQKMEVIGIEPYISYNIAKEAAIPDCFYEYSDVVIRNRVDSSCLTATITITGTKVLDIMLENPTEELVREMKEVNDSNNNNNESFQKRKKGQNSNTNETILNMDDVLNNVEGVVDISANESFFPGRLKPNLIDFKIVGINKILMNQDKKITRIEYQGKYI